MFRICLVSFVSLLLFSACKKAAEQEPIPTVPGPLLTISGITETDVNGIIIGATDSTDWTKDAVWNEKEKALFNFTDTLNYTTILDSVPVHFNPVYPNPVETICAIAINADNSTIYKFVLVDENYTVLAKLARKTKDNHLEQFNLDVSALKVQGKVRLLRVYYAFYTSSKTIYYKGHGDLKVMPK